MEIIHAENFIKKIDWEYLKQYFTGGISLFRYYQNIFIKQFGAECRGKVLEIGADKSFSYKNYFPNANEYLCTNITGDFDLIVDGSDNFRTRFLINDYCLKNKKTLVSGAISKFDGQVYTFNFSKKNSPCLRCYIPHTPTNLDVDNCEYEGVLGTLGGIIGSIQANEVAKEILEIGDTLCGHILIIDALKLTFRKVKLNKRSDCYCNGKK